VIAQFLVGDRGPYIGNGMRDLAEIGVWNPGGACVEHLRMPGARCLFFRGLDVGGAGQQHAGLAVGHGGGRHAPNAKGNFCFEVTLGYRRLERGR